MADNWRVARRRRDVVRAEHTREVTRAETRVELAADAMAAIVAIAEEAERNRRELADARAQIVRLERLLVGLALEIKAGAERHAHLEDQAGAR